jgi:SAM-dependent methyltransferase
MKENKYDDPGFFAAYGDMERSKDGLPAAGEWHAFQALLPSLQHKKLLDLGCGYGWHCRYAREQGATAVTGTDISEKMLARAKGLTRDAGVTYLHQAIEDMHFAQAAFDVVISSLAFHYIANFKQACERIYACLQPGGAFVFSVEHPLFTANAAQDWYHDAQGRRLHWPVDDYQEEGIRTTHFLGHEVIKYHRTFATYINSLIDAGFNITRIIEPLPSADMLEKIPGMQDETRRPMFLLIAATKPA